MNFFFSPLHLLFLWEEDLSEAFTNLLQKQILLPLPAKLSSDLHLINNPKLSSCSSLSFSSCRPP